VRSNACHYIITWARFSHTRSDLIWFTKVGILQYVPIKVAQSAIMFVCEQFGVWRAGTFSILSAHAWYAMMRVCVSMCEGGREMLCVVGFNTV
jgi:hypothetical protein